MSRLITRSRDPEPSPIALDFARHSQHLRIPEAMKTVLFTAALLLLLSQVTQGNLDPFRGSELGSGAGQGT